MPALRSPRRERFAREYIKTGIGSEAYRRAYERQQRDATARANASRLLTIDCVSHRVSELREQAMKRADITIDKILSDYQYALEMAKEQAKPNDITNAATAQAKLVGLLRERVEAGNVGDFDGMESISEILEAVNSQAGPEAALALAKAFGLEKVDDLTDAKPASDAVN